MGTGKDGPFRVRGKLLEEQDGDTLREGIRVLAQALMESDPWAWCDGRRLPHGPSRERRGRVCARAAGTPGTGRHGHLGNAATAALHSFRRVAARVRAACVQVVWPPASAGAAAGPLIEHTPSVPTRSAPRRCAAHAGAATPGADLPEGAADASADGDERQATRERGGAGGTLIHEGPALGEMESTTTVHTGQARKRGRSPPRRRAMLCAGCSSSGRRRKGGGTNDRRPGRPIPGARDRLSRRHLFRLRRDRILRLRLCRGVLVAGHLVRPAADQLEVDPIGAEPRTWCAGSFSPWRSLRFGESFSRSVTVGSSSGCVFRTIVSGD
jgi:hypothetical protein